MDINGCAKALAEARTAFDEVEVRKKKIEREMTVAVNRLNDAQKTFDAAVSEVRKNAPWNTDWHRQNNPKQCVRAT